MKTEPTKETDVDYVTLEYLNNLKVLLKSAPNDYGFVVPGGTAIVFLVNDELLIIPAPVDRTFSEMSDNEVNNHIVNTLTP